MSKVDLKILKKEQIKIIYKHIQEVAEHLRDKLPPSHFHPKGRNPNAHMFQMIKQKFGCSCKDVEDIIALKVYINWLKANPC